MDPQPTVYVYTTLLLLLPLLRITISLWWAPCISRLVLYLRPVLTVACCCLIFITRHAAWLCTLTVLCLRCLRTVSCRKPTDRPACTLAVNLKTVSRSCTCCNCSCNFLSPFMKLGPCFNWCSIYRYARRHKSITIRWCSIYAGYLDISLYMLTVI